MVRRHRQSRRGPDRGQHGQYRATRTVATREKLEHRIGKAAAGLYAMVHTLRHGQPVRINYDDNTVTTSLFFLGNGLPSVGIRPARRTRMDDGLIDVRILETGRWFSRVRIMMSLALGRLERSPLYHEHQVPSSASPLSTGRSRLPATGGGRSLHRCEVHHGLPCAPGLPPCAVGHPLLRSAGASPDMVGEDASLDARRLHRAQRPQQFHLQVVERFEVRKPVERPNGPTPGCRPAGHPGR